MTKEKLWDVHYQILGDKGSFATSTTIRAIDQDDAETKLLDTIYPLDTECPEWNAYAQNLRGNVDIFAVDFERELSE